MESDAAGDGSEESGEVCGLESCMSTLVVSLDHDFDFSAGGYSLVLLTPLHEIRCSINATASGDESCFGFRFSDVHWDPGSLRITLTEAFFDTELNPDATPFEQVELMLNRDGAAVFSQLLEVDGGEAQQPNGAQCGPTCWAAQASADARAG